MARNFKAMKHAILRLGEGFECPIVRPMEGLIGVRIELPIAARYGGAVLQFRHELNDRGRLPKGTENDPYILQLSGIGF